MKLTRAEALYYLLSPSAYEKWRERMERRKSRLYKLKKMFSRRRS